MSDDGLLDALFRSFDAFQRFYRANRGVYRRLNA
jgi:hypothetical protein